MYKVNNLLNIINNKSTRNTTSRVYRSDSSDNNNNEQLIIYDNRYKTFTTALNSIELSSYDEQKKQGFEQCLEKYIKIANNNSKNLDVIYENLEVDLQECNNKIKEDANNFFIIGYQDCLKIIDYFLQESKKAFFNKIAEII